MTDKDKQLIAEAEKKNCIDWPLIDLMAQKADTPEAARELSRIASRKYHMEEYQASNL